MTAVSPRVSPLQKEPASRILSVSLSVFALLFVFLALLAEGDGLLRDPDIFWHIEVGRRILPAPSRGLTSYRTPSKAIPGWPARICTQEEINCGKVYHDFSFNGYLIFRGVKTFIDGRTDQLFGGGFMTRVFEAGKRANDELLKLLDEHKITSAIVVPGSNQAVKLDKSRFWLRRYEDDTAAVYQRARD